MAFGNATACSASAGLNKLMKEWREAVKYLPRVDRAGLMRRCGSVLTVNMVALRQVKERRLADQRQQQKKKAAVDCSNCGVTQSSRPNRAGNRLERRQRERGIRSLDHQYGLLSVFCNSLT